MAPGERLAIDLAPEQRERILRVLAHRGGRIVEEQAAEEGRIRIIAERTG